MSAAAKLLDRLALVKQTAPGKWLARCPAHEDGSPSLSIREIDGKLLVYCFAGCGAVDVMESVGLSLSDLYDAPLDHHFAPTHSRIPASDLLVILDHEITVAVLILSDIAERRKVNEGQIQRLCQAARRIGSARDMANPEKVRRHAA
jgi:hypothetical protein